MLIDTQDIFSVIDKADAICFTSNGCLTRDSRLVMGAGVAKLFKDKFLGLDVDAGILVKRKGNVCQIVYNIMANDKITYIISFPTKHHWKHPSDLGLITKSANELMILVDKHNLRKVYLPCPGIGLGGLSSEVVLGAIKNILDDRVVVLFK